MNQFDTDKNTLKSLAESVANWCVSFQHELPHRKVAVLNNPRPPVEGLQSQGLGSEAAFSEFVDHISHHLSASAGPRYLGFVTGGTTPAAMLADWITSAIDQNVFLPGDSIATAVEVQTLSWLRELFHLNDDFHGTLTSGATAANILGTLCGRQFAGEQQGIDIANDGLNSAEIEVFSACPHASTLKALSFIGLGRKQITEIPCLPDSEAMDVKALGILLKESHSTGKIVIASAGTVTGTDFDDLNSIAELTKKYNAWLHVDGAFGLFTRLLPNSIALTEGINGADSITTDGHKWLNVPYDCGIFFTRHPKLLSDVCSVAAPYLDINSQLPSYGNMGIENSRRFRALPVWMTLKAYGRDGYRELVENNCQQATLLADWISQSQHYELLYPCQLNVVVFRPRSLHNFTVSDILQKINHGGEVYMTPGKWKGQEAIRAAFCNWQTTNDDVKKVCKVLDSVLSTSHNS